MSKKSPAKLLKEKGLIPKGWDLRKPLTSGQKSWITKQSKVHAQLIKRPGDFTIRRVGNATAKQLKASGYKVENNRAIIHSKQSNVRIKRGEIEIQRPHQTERVILKGGPDFLRQLQNLDKRKLAPNQAYGLKIGDSPTINTIRPSLRELIQYARNLNFHSAGGQNHVSIVLITVRGPGLVGHANPDLDDDDDQDEDEGEDDDGGEYV